MKSGWYKKGNSYRFVYSVQRGFIYFQTKSKFGSKEIKGVNAEFDTWFDKAEYVGLVYQGMGFKEALE